MTGIIDYFPLLGGGGGGFFPHRRKPSHLPTSNNHRRLELSPSSEPRLGTNKSATDKGSWGGPLESCCTLAERLSTRILFNVLWKGKMFPAVVHSPVSRFYSRRLRLHPSHPPPHLQRSSSQRLADSPPYSPSDGTEGPIEALIGDLKA